MRINEIVRYLDSEGFGWLGWMASVWREFMKIMGGGWMGTEMVKYWNVQKKYNKIKLDSIRKEAKYGEINQYYEELEFLERTFFRS